MKIFSILLIICLSLFSGDSFAKNAKKSISQKHLTVAKRLQRHAIAKLQKKQVVKRKSILGEHFFEAGLSQIPGRKVAIFGWGKKSEDEEIENEAEVDAADDAQAATPNTLGGDEITPELIEIIPQGPLTATQPWQKPDYSGQVGALGWSSKVFDVPPGMKDRVAFWKEIYSKYTTNQGVIHDSLHINIVYQPVDFSSIMRDSSLNPRQKHHAREHLVKSYRHEIEERLRRLAKLNSGEGLQGEDLRVWKMFEPVNDPDKFNAATKRGRIRFQLGQKDRFALGIYYSGRYIREMEKIYKSEGLPIELTRLPFVESSFNIYARSRVGASGVWQFMRRTARPYMMVNNAVDERNDPIRATRSAARLLRSNYMLLKSWPLALTGWNHGPNGVARIVRKIGTTDLAQIINLYSSRRFGFASENFYACFLAALEVEQNANKYFGPVKWSVPLDHAEIKLSKPVPFEAVNVWFKDDDQLAQLYNPHFSNKVRIGRMNMPKGTNVRVPPSMKELAERYLSGNVTLAKMKEEAKRMFMKIPVIPEGTPVSTISAAPSPTVSPTPQMREAAKEQPRKIIREDLSDDAAENIVISPENTPEEKKLN